MENKLNKKKTSRFQESIKVTWWTGYLHFGVTSSWRDTHRHDEKRFVQRRFNSTLTIKSF